MSKDQDASAKQDDLKPDEAERAAAASADAKRSKKDEDELEEGLEESMPGSDAPASTRRSEKG